MPVKFFDAPISDDELANLNEASAVVTLDPPTLSFKRPRVATAPMPWRPGATETQVEQVVTRAQPAAVRERRAPRRLGQWLLALAIVAGLGVAGHFVGAGARASAAIARVNGPADQAVATHSPVPEMVAAPVVRITAPPAATVEAQPAVKPKPREHARREAPPVADTSKVDVETTTEPSAAGPATTETAKTETATSKPSADDDLMRQAAETLSNAQLENP